MRENHSIYTCLMHPEVMLREPGNCPKCGMALRQAQGKHLSHEGMDHEQHDHMEHHAMMAQDFKKRFFVSLPITILILLLSPQIQGWLGITIDFPGKNLALFVLGTAIAYYGGWPFYQAAKNELKTRNYGMMTLVSLAVLASYFFSVGSTFFYQARTFYWETATLILAFLFGHWIEMRAVVGTGGALKELAKLIPPTAHKIIKKGKKEEIADISTEQLQKKDLVLVRPGEKIPADGKVVKGGSDINEALITGESRPIIKKKGDDVIGGTINGDGSLTVEVTKTGSESALSQIMDLIRQAQNTKPSVQNLADKAANYLTLIAIVVGASTFLYWFFLNPQGTIFASTLAITVVVITCPHALGLAIPTVTTITSSLAAKNGILIRDMKGLEVAKDVDYIVFDKTGTLTKGEFGVSEVKVFGKGVSREEVLKLAAAIELNSEHAIAKGIVNKARKRNIDFSQAKQFKAIKGKGARGRVGKSKIILGTRKFLEDEGVKVQESEGAVGSIVYIAKDTKHIGTIILEDEVREESSKVVAELHNMGIKVAMLTGDKKEIAERVGKHLGIDTLYSEVLPEDKVDKVRQLQKMGHKVAMVGDGVNDAPSLTQAHVGIAIGAGTSVAIESAEIVLVKSDPLDVVKLMRLSKSVDNKMKQNLAWAVGYNALAIPAAAGVFYSWGLTLRPEWGALLMSASSVIVVANALLLKQTKL
jgi:Cu2+-exporting ATPase